MLELWHRDKQTKDLLLGVAEVPLSNVLSSARVPVNVRLYFYLYFYLLCDKYETKKKEKEKIPCDITDAL